MPKLNIIKVSGDKFIVGTTGTNGTDGYNSITDRVNLHTHDGVDTEPVDKRETLDLLFTLRDNNLSAGTYLSSNLARKTYSTLSPATTSNAANITESTEGYACLVPNTMQTLTMVASDNFADVNSWGIVVGGGGFFQSTGGELRVGGTGSGDTARATYSGATFNVNNLTAFEWRLTYKNAQGGGGNNLDFRIIRQTDSVQITKSRTENGINAGDFKFVIGNSTSGTYTVGNNNSMVCRIAQVNSQTLYVQWAVNAVVAYAGFVNNLSTANTFQNQISYVRNAAGNDSVGFDDFRAQRSAGFANGYSQISGNDTNLETTNINRMYPSAVPYLSNTTILQTGVFSGSSDSGATFTQLSNNSWNTLTSTLGKQAVLRTSVGSDRYILKGHAVAWANSST